MTVSIVYLVVLLASIPLLGTYMYRVFASERIGRIEGVIYKLLGTDPEAEQTWRAYARSVLWFSAAQPAGSLRAAPAPGDAAAEPSGPRRSRPLRLVQHDLPAS